jgi:hypothetical protein
MSLSAASLHTSADHDRALRLIEERVLWLATAIVDHANRVRPNPAGLKVGGHQASSASMVRVYCRPDRGISPVPTASRFSADCTPLGCDRIA